MLLTEKFQPILESDKFAPISSSEKLMMAQLLENMEKEEARSLTEGTLTSDVAQFTPILIPLVRRVYPNLIANEIAGVQALNMPSGYLYAMVSTYTGTSTNSIHPNNKGQIVTLDDASAFVVGGDISAASGATGKVVYIEGTNVLVGLTGSVLFVSGDDVDNASTFSASVATVGATFSNENGFQKVLKGYTGPMATSTAEQLGNDMKEIGFDIRRALAEAKSRKLKGKYTLEMMNDLRAMHGLDAEQELMNLMAMELQLELDREIIQKANDLATVTSDAVINGYAGRWEIEKYRGLGIKIANEAREIGRLTRKGAGNTMIVSSKVATALDTIGSFTLAPVKGGVDSVISGITPSIGYFDGKYKVVTDNFATSDYATVLYKGQNSKDCGVFFAPYQAASFVKTQDPTSGQPALILSSRYDIVPNPLNPETYFRSFNVNFGNTIIGA